MKTFVTLVCCAVLTVMLGSAVAAQQIMRPQPGSELRKELLDSIRPVFEGETWGPVEFVVNKLNVSGDWAFGAVRLQRPGGRAIDWRRTRHAEAQRQGMFDPGGSFFLLARMGSGWAIVRHAVGPTDVVWDGWRAELDLPPGLFE